MEITTEAQRTRRRKKKQEEKNGSDLVVPFVLSGFSAAAAAISG
jgi:hypothetical protein